MVKVMKYTAREMKEALNRHLLFLMGNKYVKLKNFEEADLQEIQLKEADLRCLELRGVDLDFSCFTINQK